MYGSGSALLPTHNTSTGRVVNELYAVIHYSLKTVASYSPMRLMDGKTNQSNSLTMRLITGCALWSVKYGKLLQVNEVEMCIYGNVIIQAETKSRQC